MVKEWGQFVAFLKIEQKSLHGAASVFTGRHRFLFQKYYNRWILRWNSPKTQTRNSKNAWGQLEFQQVMTPNTPVIIARNFLKENFPEVIDWPSKGPAIENLWSGLGSWRNGKILQMIFLIHLSNSVRSRCEQVIQNKGNRIN